MLFWVDSSGFWIHPCGQLLNCVLERRGTLAYFALFCYVPLTYWGSFIGNCCLDNLCWLALLVHQPAVRRWC